MSKMLKCLIVPGILLVITSNALSSDNNWVPANKTLGGDRLWSNPDNWEIGLPAEGDGDKARIETGIGMFVSMAGDHDSPSSADVLISTRYGALPLSRI